MEEEENYVLEISTRVLTGDSLKKEKISKERILLEKLEDIKYILKSLTLEEIEIIINNLNLFLQNGIGNNFKVINNECIVDNTLSSIETIYDNNPSDLKNEIAVEILNLKCFQDLSRLKVKSILHQLNTFYDEVSIIKV